MTSRESPGERRLRRRHGLDDVRGNVLFSYECRILNLSEQGVAVRTTAALAPGRSYSVKVQHEGRQIPLAGTVAWCRLQGTEKTSKGEPVALYTAGIELDEQLSERLSRQILPLLEQRGVARLERRLHGHVAPHGAGGSDPTTVTVREVSRAGMILETPLRPETGDLLGLRLELDEEELAVTARAVRVRPLAEREVRGWSEVTVEYAELSPTDRGRLDDLIREELGLAKSPAS